ncbi:MAG: aldose 1-epimerase family protein, partial [Oscillospiraceae bacterium]|nr:aldose 1-epimerase family protein [Oscillospiraceae bacterium]
MEYTLSYKGFEAIVDNIGAELISFKDAQGTEYIWQGHPSGWTGKNPNLFPAIGAVKSEGILYDGKAYPTPRHGFARHSAFSLVEKTASSITMELCSNADTLALYPYPFRLRIRHGLGEGSFTTSYEVLNIGEANMHYCVGGHTAFNCPLFGDGSFEDWRITFAKEETVPAMLPLEGGFIDFNYTMPAIKEGRYIPLDHSLHDKIDTLIFRDLNSTSVSL